MRRAFLYLYILGLVSFFAPSMGAAWVGNLRFVVVAPLLVLATIKSGYHPTRISLNVLAAIWVFLAWCLLTCFWSENFTMSVLKLGIYGGTVMAFCLGGMIIPAEHPELNPFLASAPIFCYAVIGSVFSPSTFSGNLVGISGNSNHLAASIVFSMPWYFVELRRKWTRRYMRGFLVAIGIAALVVLVLTRSRTMIVSAIACSFLLFASLRPGRKIILIYGLTIGLMISVAMIPNLFSTIRTTYVFKSSDRLLESRGDQMADSFYYAKQGGAIGLGFGVSSGMGRYWEIGQTFTSYSREKGNSLLAVTEEIGVVGLTLWLGLLGLIASEFRTLGRNLSTRSTEHFIYLLALGFLLGAFVGSMAEAWILSPSPETAMFWATVGLSIGALRCEATRPVGLGRAA